MGRADIKKKEFKERVRLVWHEYRPFLQGCGIGIIILIIGGLISTYREAQTYQWDINTIVEANYHAEIRGEDAPFVLVHGELEAIDLLQIRNAASGRESVELPLYVMEEGHTVDERIDYFVPHLVTRIESHDGRYEVIDFTSYPEVAPNVAAVNDWDIYTEESVFDNGGLVLKGYIDPAASSVDVIAQLNGLNDITASLNEDDEEAEYNHVLYEFQHGDDVIRHHSAYENVLGRVVFYQSLREGAED